LSRFNLLSVQHREFWTQEKAAGTAKMSQGNFKRTIRLLSHMLMPAAKGSSVWLQIPDFYRLRLGLHDNLYNAAYAKCAAMAAVTIIALAKHAITW
jgi:hypothetical protein